MNNKIIMYIGFALIIVGFILLYGTVGSLDNETISLKESVIGALFGFTIMVCGGLVSNKGGSRVD